MSDSRYRFMINIYNYIEEKKIYNEQYKAKTSQKMSKKQIEEYEKEEEMFVEEPEYETMLSPETNSEMEREYKEKLDGLNKYLKSKGKK